MSAKLQLLWQIAIAGLRARLSRRPQRVAIFAGAGELPLIAAETAKSRKINFIIYHIVEADLNPDLLANTAIIRRSVSLGNIAQTLQFLQQDKITQVILLGKVEKQRLLQDVKRDAAANEIYSRAPDRRDDALAVLRGQLAAVDPAKTAPVREPYLTLREVGQRLGISSATLWRWQVPGHSLGGRRRFRLSEVEAYLKTEAFERRAAALRADRKHRSGEAGPCAKG